MKLLTFSLQAKLFLWLTLSFVLCTIIGTVSHELGHAAVAASQGRDWTLHYASLSPGRPAWSYQLEAEYRKNEEKIKNDTPSPEKESYLNFRKDIAKKYKHEDLYMRLGGPLQTMLTGTIGVLMLWWNRRKNQPVSLNTKQWIFVLLGYFWSRQPAILFQKIYYSMIGHRGVGDEERIAHHLHLNEWSVITVWGIIGTAILLWITFYAIPLRQRFTFIIAGLTGSLLGAIVWLCFLGPAILP